MLSALEANDYERIITKAQYVLDSSLLTLIETGDARSVARKLGMRFAEIHMALIAGRKESAQGIAAKSEQECIDGVCK